MFFVIETKMKILYIITKSEAGGAQTHVSQLSQYMMGKGHYVAIMANPEGGYIQRVLAISNFQFPISKQIPNSKSQITNRIKFYPNPYFRNSYNPVLGLKAMREVKKVVEDFKLDIVHCHSTVAGFWTRLALRQAQGKPVVIFTAHGWGFTEGAPFLRKNLVILAEKLVAKFCDKIICVSEYDKELALKHKIAKPGKLIVIHNGVEIDKVKIEKCKAKNYTSKVKIVFVGRLSKPKDPLLLLKAFNLLTQDLKEKSEILMVGDGEKRKELERFIEENKLDEKVKLLGVLPRENVFQTLGESDIFVLTSNYEGFPMTILEAMSCGLPVIASDVGGVREAVNEDNGFLIQRGNKEGFKKALVKLIENPDLRKRMGQNARKRAEKEFSLEKMLEKTFKVYQSFET